jgi:hypothetical protein
LESRGVFDGAVGQKAGRAFFATLQHDFAGAQLEQACDCGRFAFNASRKFKFLA